MESGAGDSSCAQESKSKSRQKEARTSDAGSHDERLPSSLLNSGIWSIRITVRDYVGTKMGSISVSLLVSSTFCQAAGNNPRSEQHAAR